MKESTKQRFVGIDFGYPAPDIEAEIVCRESGADRKTARRLVDIALRSRNLRGQGLEEGASTRMLIHAGRLVAAGVGLEASFAGQHRAADHRRSRYARGADGGDRGMSLR